MGWVVEGTAAEGWEKVKEEEEEDEAFPGEQDLVKEEEEEATAFPGEQDLVKEEEAWEGAEVVGKAEM